MFLASTFSHTYICVHTGNFDDTSENAIFASFINKGRLIGSHSLILIEWWFYEVKWLISGISPKTN